MLILLSGLFAGGPNCDSNDENCFVFCLHMRSWYTVDLRAVFMLNQYHYLLLLYMLGVV